MRVNALCLHRLDDFDGSLDFGRVNLPTLIEVTAVNPHQVDAVLGQHPRALPQVRAGQLVRWAVDRPEPHRLAGPAVKELAVLHPDEALLAGESLIERTQINRAVVSKGVRLRVKRKPAFALRRPRHKGRQPNPAAQTKASLPHTAHPLPSHGPCQLCPAGLWFFPTLASPHQNVANL